MRLFRINKIVHIIILIHCHYAIAFSQNIEEKVAYNDSIIQFIKQFPEKENLPLNKKKIKLLDIIVGDKPDYLSKPFSVIAQNPENYWILEQANKTILNVNKDKISLPKYFKKNPDEYNSLVNLCFLDAKTILFDDSQSNMVYKFSVSENKIEPFNHSTDLAQPTGIAYSDLKRQLWVVETALHRIAIFNADGDIIKYIGKRGNGQEEFNYPTFIWIDRDGFAYIVDSMNFRVQIFDSEGKFVSMFGSMGDASGYFARPKGIAVDTYGHIYVADALFHVVQIFDKQGNFLYSFGGQGQGEGQFWMPVGIFIDNENFIYVADSYNSRIQIFKLNLRPNR